MIPRFEALRLPRLLAKAAAAAAVVVSVTAAAQEAFHYDTGSVDTAAHWAARSTLANALMFSGLGEPVEVSMNELDDILTHAGYTLRPPMPDMAMVSAIYAGGDPKFATTPDFGDPATLRWDSSSFDRTLDPEAQAWSIIKSTAPNFHLNFHESKEERRVALMMLPQARAQAKALADRLRNADGLFAALSPDGELAEPTPMQQAAVLWAASNIVLAATSGQGDYWHRAARDLLEPESARTLADTALAAVRALPPETATDRAIAIQSLGRFALASDDEGKRREALDLVRTHADRLAAAEATTLDELGFAVYGLVEAGRLLADDAYQDAAVDLFRSRLKPLWEDDLGAFRAPEGETLYTPRTLAALAAALNALRWHGPEDAASEAARLYPVLFETALVRAGMLLSSPLPLVSQAYIDGEAAAHFAHPDLPESDEIGLAPVFASEVRHADGAWSVADETFTTADALLLANMLTARHEGQSDAFLPEERLAALR
jgi:hypothetical protein